jgi:hypothetical protein
MGILTRGIPQQIAIDLARLNGSTVFVETGTNHGATTRWAAEHFPVVHTIERAESLYNLHRNELAAIRGVTPHFGDSREILPHIVKALDAQRAVYWLDGHWSGGETAGEQDECPLLDELACLSSRGEDIILIDDARLFLCAPPPPHRPSDWPTIPEIVNSLPATAVRPFVQVVDDVIFVVPAKEPLKSCLVNYAQRQSSAFWDEFRTLRQGTPPLGVRLRSFLARIGGRLAGR